MVPGIFPSQLVILTYFEMSKMLKALVEENR